MILIRKEAFSDGPSAKPFDFWSVSFSIAHLDWQNWLEKKLYIWKTRTCFSWVVGWGILGEMLQKVSERSLFYTFDFWIVSLSIAHLDWQKGLEKAFFFKYRFCQIVWFLNRFAQYSSSRLTKGIRKEAVSDEPSAKLIDFEAFRSV